MTEAVRAVVSYVFRHGNINRITATTIPENAASIRVLQHAGFQEEGILRDWGFWKGEFKDLRCFSLLRRDSSGAGTSAALAGSSAKRPGREDAGG